MNDDGQTIEKPAEKPAEQEVTKASKQPDEQTDYRQANRQTDRQSVRQMKSRATNPPGSDDEVFIWRATFAYERRGTQHTRQSGKG